MKKVIFPLLFFIYNFIIFLALLNLAIDYSKNQNGDEIADKKSRKLYEKSAFFGNIVGNFNIIKLSRIK